MNGDQIELFEWAKLGLAGLCASYCFLGALYVVPQLSQNAFNGIWRTRLLVQVTAFLLSVCQLLPLQLWDGEYGALNILPKNFNREILCKSFTVAALGVLQPFLLLLAGFLCSHALRDSTPHFSFRQAPILNAALVTLPFAAGQILSAFWSTWLESTVDEHDEIGRLPFSTFSQVPCPGQPIIGPDSGSQTATDAGYPFDSSTEDSLVQTSMMCISCKYTVCSVVVHVVLTLLFAVIIATFGRVMIERCGNQALRRRIHALCVLLPLLQALQCAAAAVTVVKRRPHTWTHEISKFVALVCVLALIVAVSTMLVVMPLQAAAYAIRLVEKVRQADVEATGSEQLGSAVEDAMLLSAFRTRSGTPSNSAPLLPEGSKPQPLDVLGMSPVRRSREHQLRGPSLVDDVQHRAEVYTVDRRTQERAAAYAYDDGFQEISQLSSRGEPSVNRPDSGRANALL